MYKKEVVKMLSDNGIVPLSVKQSRDTIAFVVKECDFEKTKEFLTSKYNYFEYNKRTYYFEVIESLEKE